MVSMAKPEIHWHYFGKLRTQLENEACNLCSQRVVANLKCQAEGKRYLFVPTTAESVLKEALGRTFQAESVDVFATELGDNRERIWSQLRQLSTADDTEGSEFRLSLYSGPADGLAQHLRPKSAFSRLRAFSKPNRRSDKGVVLVIRTPNRTASADIVVQVEECNYMAELARQNGNFAEVLSEPGLSRERAYEIIRKAPSAILNGSHESEKTLEQSIAQATKSSPIGQLIQSAWQHLKAGALPELFSKDVFEARVASLDEGARTAYPWEAIISFWREILYGLSSDREYADRWYSKIDAKPGGWLNLEDIHDILLYESSIYALHSMRDPSCASYLVAYHGARWVRTRMALSSVFGASGGGTEVTWE